MCDTCGCNVTSGNAHLVQGNGKLARVESGHSAVDVLQGLLHENDHQAVHNRRHFDRRGILAINLMSSPGSGKTSLLEATQAYLAARAETGEAPWRFAVIEGDLETENDADRLRARGIRAHQISTGSACHLDAHLVHQALHQMSLEGIDLVFIENVGNLVCPASFDLGHHYNVTLLSVTEGDDKPAKYPVMFRGSDQVLLTKTDLLSVLGDFDPQRAEDCVRGLANAAPVRSVSARSGEGMAEWIDWLESALTAHRAGLESGQSRQPALQPEGAVLHAGAPDAADAPAPSTP